MDVDAEIQRAVAELNQRQSRIMDIQSELSKLEVIGFADRGAVTVKMTGNGQFTAVEFDPEALRGYDVHDLGDVTLRAIQDAVSKLAAQTRDRFAEVLPEVADAAEPPPGAWPAR